MRKEGKRRGRRRGRGKGGEERREKNLGVDGERGKKEGGRLGDERKRVVEARLYS